MTVIFLDGEPEYGEPAQCDVSDDCTGAATAKVCGSECQCRVNVCREHSDWMDSRFKCPFTGSL